MSFGYLSVVTLLMNVLNELEKTRPEIHGSMLLHLDVKEGYFFFPSTTIVGCGLEGAESGTNLRWQRDTNIALLDVSRERCGMELFTELIQYAPVHQPVTALMKT